MVKFELTFKRQCSSVVNFRRSMQTENNGEWNAKSHANWKSYSQLKAWFHSYKVAVTAWFK